MKNNTIFIFIFSFLFFNQSLNALYNTYNTHTNFLDNDYVIKHNISSDKGFSEMIPLQSGHEGECLATKNAQTPSPLESCVTQKKHLQSDNLETQEVIQRLQKELASQWETLQTKQKLLQTTQTELAFLEQKNREAEEEKEAQKIHIMLLERALEKTEKDRAEAENLIKRDERFYENLLAEIEKIRSPDNHEVEDSKGHLD